MTIVRLIDAVFWSSFRLRETWAPGAESPIPPSPVHSRPVITVCTSVFHLLQVLSSDALPWTRAHRLHQGSLSVLSALWVFTNAQCPASTMTVSHGMPSLPKMPPCSTDSTQSLVLIIALLDYIPHQGRDPTCFVDQSTICSAAHSLAHNRHPLSIVSAYFNKNRVLLNTLFCKLLFTNVDNIPWKSSRIRA